MTYKKAEIKELLINPFNEIGSNWMLITAIKDGVVNTMTASWGTLGVLWNKNIATIYIRPQRYTKEFIDHSDYFTITFFEGYKHELGILGTTSGLDCDKIKEVDFEIEYVNNQPTFKEGSMVYVCKKIYQDAIKKECFFETKIINNKYQNDDYHVVYVGEILEVYKNN